MADAPSPAPGIFAAAVNGAAAIGALLSPNDSIVEPHQETDAPSAADEQTRMVQAARDATLLRAVDAKREAALAVQERDAADAHAQAALERATRERAAATPPITPLDGSGDPADNTSEVFDDQDRDALLHHEAAALINLHGEKH